MELNALLNTTPLDEDMFKHISLLSSKLTGKVPLKNLNILLKYISKLKEDIIRKEGYCGFATPANKKNSNYMVFNDMKESLITSWGHF